MHFQHIASYNEKDEFCQKQCISAQFIESFRNVLKSFLEDVFVRTGERICSTCCKTYQATTSTNCTTATSRTTSTMLDNISHIQAAENVTINPHATDR